MIAYAAIIEILITFIESLVGYNFIELLLTNKLKSLDKIIYSALLTISITVLNTFQLFSYSTTIFAILFLGGTYYLSSKNKQINALAIAYVYYLIVYIVDFFSIALMAILIGNDQFALYIVSEHSMYRNLFLCLDKFLLVSLFLVLKKYNIKDVIQINAKKILIFNSLAFCVIIYLINHTLELSSVIVAVCWLFVLALFITLFTLIVVYQRYMIGKTEIEKSKMKENMMNSYYANMKNDYHKRKVLLHDSNKNITMINNLIKEGKYKVAIEYSDYISEINADNLALYTWTGISAIDLCLNHMYSIAAEKGIKCHIESEQFSKINLSDLNLQEFSVVLLNVIENAIEACDRINTKEKWISITINKGKGVNIFTVQNSLEELPVVKNKRMITNKNDDVKIHGYGMHCMQEKIKRLDGMFECSFDTEKFTAIISLF